MKNCTDVLKLVEAVQIIIFVQIICNRQAVQVEVLFRVTQIVDYQNIFFSGIIQSLDNITADKSGSARNNNHVFSIIKLIMPDVDLPSKKGTISTLPPFFLTVSYPTISSAI